MPGKRTSIVGNSMYVMSLVFNKRCFSAVQMCRSCVNKLLVILCVRINHARSFMLNFRLCQLQSIPNCATIISERCTLCWLPVKDRIKFKVLILGWAVLVGSAQSYMQECLYWCQPCQVAICFIHLPMEVFWCPAAFVRGPSLCKSLPIVTILNSF